jgi:hypothetical protein
MSRYSSSAVIKTYDLLSAAEYAESVNASRAATGGAPRFSDAEINDFKQKGGTDWQKEIFRQATGMEYQLGMSGGTDKMNYLISGNYLDQEGIIINSGFKRYSLRANLSSQISEKFSVRLNLTGLRLGTHDTRPGCQWNVYRKRSDRIDFPESGRPGFGEKCTVLQYEYQCGGRLSLPDSGRSLSGHWLRLELRKLTEPDF